MQIFITGGLGFVGRHLCKALLEDGHSVTASGRSERPEFIDHPDFHYVAADTTAEGDWQETARQADAAVNLAGASIFSLWTDSHKQKMYDSRILTTRHLVDVLKDGNAGVLCSTSAVGYYGCRGDEELTEANAPGDDFLAQLSIDWEKEARRAEDGGIRVVLPRFGIVLDRDGGAMAKMIPAFRLLLGGPLGDGRQWFPWIHMHDLVRAMTFCLTGEEVRGALNFCAPQPVRNEKLAKTLGRVLGRPAVMRAPAFVIRKALGEFGDVLLCSQRVIPEKLNHLGFDFRFPDIGSALEEIVDPDGDG
jgi:uncharacterized protein (TIGR01777 family)